MFNLSDQNPPPPTRKVKKGREVITPKAVQHHGNLITWKQEQSGLEILENGHEQSKGRKVSLKFTV